MNKLRLVFWSISLTGLLYAGQVWAGSFQHTFSVLASEEYATNPNLIPAFEGLSTWLTTLDPAYSLTDVMGADSLKGSIDVRLIRSSNTKIHSNQTNPTASLGWRHAGEKGGFGISTSYEKSSTILTEPSALAAVTLSANSTRSARNLSADWNRIVSERTTLTLEGAYTDVRYGGNSSNAAVPFSLNDYKMSSATMKLSYELGERSTSFLNMSYVDIKPVYGGSSTRLSDAILGLKWNSSDRLNWTFQGGAYRIRGTVGGSAESNSGFQGGIIMNYKGQLTNLSLSAKRTPTPSGLGGVNLTDDVDGSFSYDLGERSKMGVDAGWRKSNYLTNPIYRTVGIWLHRDLNPFWGMKVYLEHSSNQWNNFNAGTSVLTSLSKTSSNMVGISVTYANF